MRGMQDAETIAMGEQIASRRIAPEARLQSLQWQMQTKGKRTSGPSLLFLSFVGWSVLERWDGYFVADCFAVASATDDDGMWGKRHGDDT